MTKFIKLMGWKDYRDRIDRKEIQTDVVLLCSVSVLLMLLYQIKEILISIF